MRKETLERLTAHVCHLLANEGMITFDRFARMGSRPIRFSTGAPYRGGNAVVLWATAEIKGYNSPFWLTFKQAKEAGAHVRKGETGTLILYADRWKPADADEDTPERVFMRAYTVFNAEQVEGLPETYYVRMRRPEGFDPIPRAEEFVKNTGAVVQEGKSGAFYCASDDTIRMPDRRAFSDAEGFYATLLHELVHWTGAEQRLNRLPNAKFGDPSYAREELVAELGAAFLCADLQLSKAPREDHAHYLAGWLRALEKNPMELWSAARAAETAADYLWQKQPSREQQAA
jgi:antirestriction protein ArdC